ncbi:MULTISPECIES: HAD-IIIA family hydrolase [unclassified Oceanispirochaeta]|uniref:HAD-IIIA family hydrolase n=1 Tax=unclassified Oceanispirochaeta TaxID=2635722 RepID=UPI000E08E78B|nr:MULTISPECIES: HAD-IIIA family hydrolase [unclassified Oceanispirochaeta]MBF9018334.1 HAD-IIIA family hydrolase [Oceanispirochaeta sp. M2]NPD74799.1 HAD-IIIA family hydrolase [Oceanispirochaeta sp. M1]RDG29352.1 HAD-IIIA family hydrolase [Oceanispirochaeta sp. M1]
MKSLKIGHITDIHFRHYTPGSSHKQKNRSREMLKVLEKALNVLKKEKIDILVITGDIIDTPGVVLKHNNYYMDLSTPFKQLIRKDYLTIRSILDHSGIPWIVIPGNKDEPELYTELWGDQPLVRDFKGYRFVSFHDRQWDGGQPRRFDRERRLMEAQLADPDSPPQIHLQHFVSTPSEQIKLKHVYKEADNLRKMCRDSGNVVLSLSGHYHPGIKSYREEKTTWISGPAFCAIPHPVLIHELEGNALQKTSRLEIQKKSIHKGKPAVFMDRDGVIATQSSYTTGPEEMKLIPGAGEAILKLRKAGFAVVINTNQSCIGLGYVPESVVLLNHEYMCHLLVNETGDIESQPDAIYFSSGAGNLAVHPDYTDTTVTKPSPELLHKACSLLGLSMKNCWMIGDREGDLRCALNGRVKPLLVRTGDGNITEENIDQGIYRDLVVKNNILEAAEFIINNSGSAK